MCFAIELITRVLRIDQLWEARKDRKEVVVKVVVVREVVDVDHQR